MVIANSHKIPRVSWYSGGQSVSNMSSPNKNLSLCIPQAPPLAGLNIPFELILLNNYLTFIILLHNFIKARKKS